MTAQIARAGNPGGTTALLGQTPASVLPDRLDATLVARGGAWEFCDAAFLPCGGRASGILRSGRAEEGDTHGWNGAAGGGRPGLGG